MAKLKVSKKKGLLDTLLEKYGEDIIWDPSKKVEPKVEVIPIKTKSVNWVLSRGGFPRGRITMVAGPESSGKTTLCYQLVSEVQSFGGVCAWIEIENTLDPTYMGLCGVDYKKLIICQPEYAEQALEIVENLVNNDVDLVVMDSVADLSPKAEIDADMADQTIALQARVISRHLRRIKPLLKGSKTAIVFINQLRDKIGVFGFGPKTSTPGGRALKHSSSIILEMTRTTPLKVGTKQVGFMTKLKVSKNKVGAPFRDVEVPLVFNYGIDDRLDFITLAIKSGAIKKRASIFYIGNTPIGNGWLEAYEKIQKREKAKEAISARIDQMLLKWSDAGSSESSKDEE